MSQIIVDGLVLSKNAKTGLSINFDHSTCRPTPWCNWHCYGKRRKLCDAIKHDSTNNNGPITWDKQQERYRMNTELVRGLRLVQAESLGCSMAEALMSRGWDNIRWNGLGDLFPEVLPVIAALCKSGVTVWGFSRKAEMLCELAELVEDSERKPIFTASIDKTTKESDLNDLLEATSILTGLSRTALAVMREKDMFDLPGLRVVFGYHASAVKTKINHPLACPSTNGENVKCQDCRRCFT